MEDSKQKSLEVIKQAKIIQPVVKDKQDNNNNNKKIIIEHINNQGISF